MKILYYSTLAFTDCDFPLIREYQKQGIKCKYMLSVLCTKLSGGLFRIEKQIPKSKIIRGDKYQEFKAYEKYVDLSDLHIINRTKRGLHPLNIILYIKFIFFILRFKPDIIHITHPLWGAELLLYIFAYKMVLTVHDPFVHSGEGDKTEHRARKLAFHLCKKLVLLNSKQKEAFVSEYKIKKEKVFINSLGIYDCLNVWSGKKKESNGKYILMFGRISPYKGVEILCDAMRIVHKYHPDISCIIAGGGKLYFDFSPYKNETNIRLINRYIPTEELVDLIKKSLFIVCPYKDATQSGVVFSSFAFYKPVVASNVGALSDVVKDGITGMLVQPNSSKELAEAIVKMLNSPHMLSLMENNIKKIFSNGEYSWNSITKKYISIYNA